MEWSPLSETASKCHSGKRDDPLTEKGDEMEIATVGLDLAIRTMSGTLFRLGPTA
jgi:hypothetical protein